VTVQRIPPPPPIANSDPAFNRWLLELTRILNASGTIDPSNVDGLIQLEAEVQNNTADVQTLETSVLVVQISVSNLQIQVLTLSLNLDALEARVTDLEARAQVFTGAGAPGAGLGSVGDWYGDPAGGVGARIWIKTAAAVWTAFPF
jgi:hypothetical protein